MAQQIQRYWRAVGLDVRLRGFDRHTYVLRQGANLPDAALWPGISGRSVMLDPRYYLPFSHETDYAVAWARWYDDPAHPDAQEPPEKTRRQLALYDRLQATPDPARQTALMREILDLAADAFYVIGIARPEPGFGIQTNRFHNVPAVIPQAWVYPDPAPTNPSQYFID